MVCSIICERTANRRSYRCRKSGCRAEGNERNFKGRTKPARFPHAGTLWTPRRNPRNYYSALPLLHFLPADAKEGNNPCGDSPVEEISMIYLASLTVACGERKSVDGSLATYLQTAPRNFFTPFRIPGIRANGMRTVHGYA